MGEREGGQVHWQLLLQQGAVQLLSPAGAAAGREVGSERPNKG